MSIKNECLSKYHIKAIFHSILKYVINELFEYQQREKTFRIQSKNINLSLLGFIDV